MKILITSIVDLRKTSHNRLHQFIRHLSPNHSITVLSINDLWKTSQTDVSQYQAGVDDILKDIDIRYFTTAGRLSPYLQEVSSVATLGRILEDIDYKTFDVHLNYNTLVSGYCVARKLKSADINTVYDIADDLPRMIRNSPQIPFLLRPVGGLVGKALIDKNIKIAARVTSITKTFQDFYHIPEDKFSHISNGVDTSLFRSHPSQQLRQNLGINSDFVVGYVGVLREWVDFEPVFTAIRQIYHKKHNIRLLIVGEEGGIKGIKHLAEKYHIEDSLILTGTVPYTTVPEYISCMDACLIPFNNSAIADSAVPLKLFEYMACQKPVICSRLTDVSRLAGDKVFYASNGEEYHHNLMALYGSRELREKAGREGRRFVERSYSWTNTLSQLERVLYEAREVPRLKQL
jgi:glycosyltransferase involved in cell wall biosynthesis